MSREKGHPDAGHPEADVPGILHVDMDAFFVAVEVRRDPTLAGRPVIVGGTGNRGVVASCSYEARAFGIHSAMPTARARRLCPHAVYLAGNYDDYAQVSTEIHRIFTSFTPLVEGIALDEAFLDVAGVRRLFGAAPAVAAAIRARVADELGLACSVGVARSKFVAKLASRAAKPRATPSGPLPGRGIVVVSPEEELAFLHPKPASALWGVGPATSARLARMGITTIGDLATAPVESLVKALGVAAGRHLHDLAWGRDPRPVEPSRPAKSIGHEETYARDHHSHDTLEPEVVRMSDAVATRMRRAGLVGRTVSVKVRFGDFSTITRSHTEPAPFSTAQDIARAARRLLEGVDVSPGVRLLGVSMSALGPSPGEQLTLGELVEADHDVGPRRAAEDAVEDIRRRFGDAAVGPASLAAGGRLRVKRLGDTQWGPRRETGDVPPGPRRD